MSEDLCSTFCTHPLVDALEFDSSEAGKTLLDQDADAEKVLQVHVLQESQTRKVQKTTIDIMGICCPAEVPLVKKILEPLPGVEEVLVNVPARTVTVQHDSGLTSAAWLVKLLNDAQLEASIHHRGEWKAAHKWPNPYTIASGLMMALAFFHYLYTPLRWLGVGAVALGIPPILMRSFVSVKRCILDINVLVLIAVAGAIFLRDYLEAGSVVFLFTLADWLETRSSDKARMAISSVVSLAPEVAVLADSGIKVPVAKVAVGSILSVKAGEKVPIDGVVIFGKSAVDESSLSGESMPVQKEAGATVWAGTLNMTGYISIQTSALAEESAVSRMVRLVEEAQTRRSNVEKLVEKFAKYYTPVVVVAAAGVAVIPFVVHAHNVRHWLYVALVLLVVACPCALVISTPVATTCAIARAAKMGVVVKSGSALEALGKLKALALDKTGTLTEGHFQVMDVRAVDENMELAQLLHWVASIESQSSHPLAASLVAYAKLHGNVAPLEKVDDFNIIDGEGVSGVIHGHTVHIGNERLARRFSWNQGEAVDEPALMESWRSQGWSISWIGVDENLKSIVCAGDPLRVEAQEFVQIMKKLGVRLVMLTGDSFSAATVAQTKLGELEVHAQLFPQDKVDILSNMKTKLGYTGMVGDGINDAPALAAADVGIAMGVAGSAVVMETADVALMTNDLRQLAAAVKLGQKVRWKIGENLVLSLATKLLIILLAAFGYASLWAAVLADVGTCLIVIFNSMFLLRGGGWGGHHHHHKNCYESSALVNFKDENDHHGTHLAGNDINEHPHNHHHHHHHHHRHKHDSHPTSCAKKEIICYLKLKLSHILNYRMGNRRDCCSPHLVVKSSCDPGNSTEMRCRLDHKSANAKQFYGLDCSSINFFDQASVDMARNVTDTLISVVSAHDKQISLEQDFNLCAAYCDCETVWSTEGAFSS